MSTLQLGQVLDGKYRIVRLIGEGGMGAVYEGENARIRRKVAIKLLHAGVADNSEMVQRFEREAQVAGTVGNDHILEILDLGALPSGERYMVMEFLEGVTLTDRIREKGRLPAADAVMLVKQVLRGLAAAHAAGIVHRDLKPDNIFILKQKAGHKDFVKIIDFGISKFTEQGATSRMTRTGALMGTPHYMAPEQATGSSDVDVRTDIYAVGIILYEAVTGRVPFQAETFNQLLFEIALAKITPARDLVPELDDALDSIILKASARDPVHRFQTCEEFWAALEEWSRTGQSVSLPPEQSLEAVVKAAMPRAGQMPSVSSFDAGGRASVAGGSVPDGSIARASAVAVSVAAASPPAAQPTLNTWANTQDDVVLPKSGGSTLVVATLAGMLLLGGGAAGAYFMLRSSPAPAAAQSGGATGVAAAPAVPAQPEQPAAPGATPPSVVPAAPAPAEVTPAASAEPPAAAPAPATPLAAAQVQRPIYRKAAPKPPPAKAAPAPAPAPAPVAAPAPAPAKKKFNFGY